MRPAAGRSVQMSMSVTCRRTVAPGELERSEADREARAWRVKGAEFAQAVAQPLGVALDRLTPRALAPSSPLHEFIAQAHREHFTRLTDSEALGGTGISRTAEYIVLEELAAADAGLAALLIAAPLPFRYAHSAGEISLSDRLGRPYFGGSTPSLSGCLVGRAGRDLHRARHDGGGWLLSGPAGVVTIGAASATHAAIVCCLGDSVQPQALAIVALDRAGVRRRPPEDRVGLRPGGAAELALADVRLERDELIRQHGAQANLTAGALAIDQLAAAVASVGIARSAYEGAARWAAERDLRAVLRIAPMRTMLERARGLTRAAHLYVHRRLDAGEPLGLRQAVFARMLASQTAVELARQSLWVVGPAARDPDGVEHLDGSRFRPEKLVRDAHELSLTRPRWPRSVLPPAINPLRHRSGRWDL